MKVKLIIQLVLVNNDIIHLSIDKFIYGDA